VKRKERLDVALVDRGLAPSRERARALILAGQVTVNGTVISKAGTAIALDAQVDLTTPDHPYVGRGGVKLAHALEVFGVEVAGRRALDIGASTGGFTDVLLQRGAASVIALDVGRGQLDWRLRTDPRVLVREGVNARALVPGDLPHPVEIVVIDVSFISLRLVLPAVQRLLTPHAWIVALIKPQFEAGIEQVGKGGVVRDPAVHAAVLAEVLKFAAASGLPTHGLTRSPITGPAGNVEYLLLLRTAPDPPDATPDAAPDATPDAAPGATTDAVPPGLR